MSNIMVLDLNLTFEDNGKEQFWDDRSEILNKRLWLPHIQNGSSNYSENHSYYRTEFHSSEISNKSIKISKNTILAYRSDRYKEYSSPVDKAFPGKIKITKKIQIYPHNEERYIKALDTYRCAYNMSVESLKNGEPICYETCKRITDEIKDMYKNNANYPFKHFVYNVDMIGEAYRKSTTRHLSLLKQYKKDGVPFNMEFMSWKRSPRYFMVKNFTRDGSILPRQLGKVDYSEEITPESYHKLAVVKYEYGKWYVCIQKHLTINELILDGNICSIDPGVRTFATLYNENQVVKYGDEFNRRVLQPVVLSISKWISKRAKFINKFKSSRENTQYYQDMLKFFDKKLNKLRSRRNNLIQDLHKRIAYDIVQNNDVILLPRFETSKMKPRDKTTGRRKMRKSIILSLMNLSHFKFKRYIRFLALKYGKLVIDDVNEAYTTRTFNGKIISIGGKKQIKDNDRTIDRDVNGARNILIRYLTKFTLQDVSILHV